MSPCHSFFPDRIKGMVKPNLFKESNRLKKVHETDVNIQTKKDEKSTCLVSPVTLLLYKYPFANHPILAKTIKTKSHNFHFQKPVSHNNGFARRHH